MILKINYVRKKWFGITSPFYHSSFEINKDGKIRRIGFYEKFDAIWPFSLLIPLPGEIREEANSNKTITLSKDDHKIKKVLKLVDNKKYQWKVYHALFRNCFHWRNSILKEAGIEYPKKDWF